MSGLGLIRVLVRVWASRMAAALTTASETTRTDTVTRRICVRRGDWPSGLGR